ncbi:glyoxylase-like metal-dependent hydrolase (beta-lactamase superfamily II) [Streptomyces griseochromogenes]|uniref:Glyoxylase-like metal-dependent hydrolase (Beta-lactamase superfamily II) n=1 Tax=Streptomyces griseochromogenes TaxID=68214 RepID=A0A1B1B1Z5_9ACTN|nr:MBL fold metallo-hydrolase [Streptomyces griseochromogenes]ANP52846.1 MBL fold metallo-hydrolase [Streptomyces griseochromogenes]MBP2047467.1 glyoxylase-like metal-dependent hydrolase (beta-lactamase superfamily II) [Streptomyces griseochromogenes]
MQTSPAAPLPSWTVGDVTVHRVDEVPLPPATGAWLLPDATAEVVTGEDWLHPDFADREGVLRIDSHSFAFVVDGLRVLVDTGIGNGKERANPAWHNLRTDFLERLTAGGFAPESVDLVILTHLHADHVGWNTREVNGAWVPTFPGARYLTSRTEREFWAGYDMEEARRQMFRDSVIPVEQAGLLDLVDVPDGGVEIAPGLRLTPTPGHTPGHLAVELTSRGETALITGDCIHHPVQLAHPAIGACVDIDPRQSEASRRKLLGSAADTDTLVLGTHFAPPTAGRVITRGDAYRLLPVPAV